MYQRWQETRGKKEMGNDMQRHPWLDVAVHGWCLKFLGHHGTAN